MINPDRLTVKSAEALNDALGFARRNGNPLVYDLHLLHALLAQEESIVVPILQKLGVNVAQLVDGIGREIGRYPKQTGGQPSLSREMNQVIDRAEEEARTLGDDYVSTEHLLLALADTKGTESKTLLGAVGADRASLLEALKAPFAIAGHEAFVGASIGLTLYPSDGGATETLLRNADTAMYRAKQAGRNRVEVVE